MNDYLARRDSEWVGQVHRFLGLQVGLVQTGLSVSDWPAADGLLSQCLHSFAFAMLGGSATPSIVSHLHNALHHESVTASTVPHPLNALHHELWTAPETVHTMLFITGCA